MAELVDKLISSNCLIEFAKTDICEVCHAETWKDCEISCPKKALFEFIDDFPKGEFELVRHGKWLDVGEGGVHTHFECSCCNAKLWMMYAEDFPYCGKCGAKMDGGAE